MTEAKHAWLDGVIEDRMTLAVEGALRAEIIQVRRKLKRAIEQRDRYKARSRELKSYVTKYQKELAVERTRRGAGQGL